MLQLFQMLYLTILMVLNEFIIIIIRTVIDLIQLNMQGI